MGNCLNKHRDMLAKDCICLEEDIDTIELEAYISLEYSDITTDFKNKFGKDTIESKIKQQYYTIKYHVESDPDMYIQMSIWKLRYVLCDI
tara:strand:+ start:182 stop:451 length:270 start_codon:yes stop_codon:yes gene_type:complete